VDLPGGVDLEGHPIAVPTDLTLCHAYDPAPGRRVSQARTPSWGPLPGRISATGRPLACARPT
jgi:hypothetical protein